MSEVEVDERLSPSEQTHGTAETAVTAPVTISSGAVELEKSGGDAEDKQSREATKATVVLTPECKEEKGKKRRDSAEPDIGAGNDTAASEGQATNKEELEKGNGTEQSAVMCTVCLEEIEQCSSRAIAKLGCGHEFHLDCVGSVFNVKGGLMECPNCRSVQRGNWLFSAGDHMDDEDGFDDEEHEEEDDGYVWCACQGSCEEGCDCWCHAFYYLNRRGSLGDVDPTVNHRMFDSFYAMRAGRQQLQERGLREEEGGALHQRSVVLDDRRRFVDGNRREYGSDGDFDNPLNMGDDESEPDSLHDNPMARRRLPFDNAFDEIHEVESVRNFHGPAQAAAMARRHMTENIRSSGQSGRHSASPHTFLAAEMQRPPSRGAAGVEGELFEQRSFHLGSVFEQGSSSNLGMQTRRFPRGPEELRDRNRRLHASYSPVPNRVHTVMGQPLQHEEILEESSFIGELPRPMSARGTPPMTRHRGSPFVQNYRASPADEGSGTFIPQNFRASPVELRPFHRGNVPPGQGSGTSNIDGRHSPVVTIRPMSAGPHSNPSGLGGRRGNRGPQAQSTVRDSPRTRSRRMQRLRGNQSPEIVTTTTTTTENGDGSRVVRTVTTRKVLARTSANPARSGGTAFPSRGPTPNQNFVCIYCNNNRQYINFHSLRQHMRAKHSCDIRIDDPAEDDDIEVNG